MQVSKPSMTAVERAAQEATKRYARFSGQRDDGAPQFYTHGFDLPHHRTYAPLPRGAHKMTLDDINPEHVAAAFGEIGGVGEIGQYARKVELLAPEIAAPLAKIDQLLEAARVTLRKLPTKLVVHTSHLDEQSAAEVERALSPFKASPFMCANGHSLGSGTDWCHRCDEADQDRRTLPTTVPADPVEADNETRMFDERERARQTEDDSDGYGPREIHEMMKETHVIVGDHPPERRHEWA